MSEEDAEFARLSLAVQDAEAEYAARTSAVDRLRQEMEDAMQAVATSRRTLSDARTLLSRVSKERERAARSAAKRAAVEARKNAISGEDIAAGGYNGRGRRQKLSESSGASYVPDGLTPEEWERRKEDERPVNTNLGAWGSKVGGPSEPQPGDIMSRPNLWTDPAAYFQESRIETYEPAQETPPSIYDVDVDDPDPDGSASEDESSGSDTDAPAGGNDEG